MISLNNLSERKKGIERRFKRLKNLVSREKWDDVDRMFFSFEQLPPHGKEYWFLLFTSNKPETGRQFMTTIGNQNVKNYVVDSCRISKRLEDDGVHNGPFSFWLYDRKIHKSKTLASRIEMVNGKMRVHSGKTEFLMEGNYPRYKLKLKENGRDMCSIRTKSGSDYTDYEVREFFKGAMGFGYVNILLDFNGYLNKSYFKGQCYLQKVVVTAPLPSVPWNWGRITFSNKSVLDFLQPHISLYKLSKGFATFGRFYDSRYKKLYTFKKIKVRKFGKRNRQFLVHGRSKGREFTMLAESYAQKAFKLSSIGKLKYEQNLVKAKSFSLESGNKLITMKDTGEGIGILEDAYGYIL